MVAGICAGLAEQFGISVTILRLAFLLSALLGGGVGIIVYLALWVVMPYGDEDSTRYTAPPPTTYARPTPVPPSATTVDPMVPEVERDRVP
jgi:phage shock protein PspC (stress-responsive transcriptional regulator)